MAMRAATIVEASSAEEATALALEHFEVAADLLAMNMRGVSKYAVTGVGFCRDLQSGDLQPRIPRSASGPWTSYRVQYRRWATPDFAQWVADNPGV